MPNEPKIAASGYRVIFSIDLSKVAREPPEHAALAAWVLLDCAMDLRPELLPRCIVQRFLHGRRVGDDMPIDMPTVLRYHARRKFLASKAYGMKPRAKRFPEDAEGSDQNEE